MTDQGVDATFRALCADSGVELIEVAAEADEPRYPRNERRKLSPGSQPGSQGQNQILKIKPMPGEWPSGYALTPLPPACNTVAWFYAAAWPTFAPPLTGKHCEARQSCDYKGLGLPHSDPDQQQREGHGCKRCHAVGPQRSRDCAENRRPACSCPFALAHHCRTFRKKRSRLSCAIMATKYDDTSDIRLVMPPL